MTKKEYSSLCDAIASLNVALGSLDLLMRDKLIKEKKTSRKYFPIGGLETVKKSATEAYIIIDKILIKSSRKN